MEMTVNGIVQCQRLGCTRVHKRKALGGATSFTATSTGSWQRLRPARFFKEARAVFVLAWTYLKHKILQTEDTNDGRLMAKACETKHQHRAAHAVTQFFPDGMVFFCVCVPNWSHLNQPRLKHETLRTANWWRQLVKASTGILRHLKRLKIIHVIHKSIHMIS